MLRTLVMMDLPIDDIANMERWYYRAHTNLRNLLPGIYQELGGRIP